MAEFMEEVRAIMGVPEWFLHEDSRKTKDFNGEKCVQIEIIFTGPNANRLEQDFNRLVRTGQQSSPSMAIPGYVPDPERKTKLSYKECSTGKKKTARNLESRTPKNSDLSGSARAQSAASVAAVIVSVIVQCAVSQHL